MKKGVKTLAAGFHRRVVSCNWRKKFWASEKVWQK